MGLRAINGYLAPYNTIQGELIARKPAEAPGCPALLSSPQHCKGGAGGARDIEIRFWDLKIGASMRDPNFWKGTFFGSLHPTLRIFNDLK